MSRRPHILARTALLAPVLLAPALLALSSCGPNYQHVANDRLNQVIKLESENQTLKQQLKDAQATTVTLQEQQRKNQPAVSTLPADRLAQLFTLEKIAIEKNSDVTDSHHDGKIDAFRVYIRTTVEGGVTAPVSGTLSLKIFDPAAAPSTQPIAETTVSPEDLKKLYYSSFGLNRFAVTIPWTAAPAGPDILISASLTDALTNRTAVDDQRIHLHLPAK